MSVEKATGLDQGSEGRRRCPRGHLIEKRYKTYCNACRQLTTEKGRASHRRNTSRNYYKRRIKYGMNRAVAKYTVVPGNAAETQRRLEVRRAGKRRNNTVYRAHWGRIDRDITHRIRWENIREGHWKEEEHPLIWVPKRKPIIIVNGIIQ